MEIPKQIQDKIAQFQEIQNQLQTIVLQKQQFSMQIRDIENALNELKNFKRGNIYEAVGPLFLETNKDKCEKKLMAEKETMDTRIKILEKQEKKLNTKLKELSQEIQSTLQSGSGGIQAG